MTIVFDLELQHFLFQGTIVNALQSGNTAFSGLLVFMLLGYSFSWESSSHTGYMLLCWSLTKY